MDARGQEESKANLLYVLYCIEQSKRTTTLLYPNIHIQTRAAQAAIPAPLALDPRWTPLARVSG